MPPSQPMAPVPVVPQDHDLITLFAEYSGLAPETVAESAGNYSLFNGVEWARCSAEQTGGDLGGGDPGGGDPGGGDLGSASDKDVLARFHTGADAYVFDLIHSNKSKGHLLEIWRAFGHLEWIQKSGPEVLEFGGGLGLACSLFRDMGRKVTYLDVDGPPSRFARWFFERTGQGDIEVLLTPPEQVEIPARQWDFVFSDAVFEHLPDPVQAAEALARAVRPGGLLYLIIDAHNVGPAFPMHRHVYMDELLEGAPSLARMERVRHDGDGLNVFRQPG